MKKKRIIRVICTDCEYCTSRKATLDVILGLINKYDKDILCKHFKTMPNSIALVPSPCDRFKKKEGKR